MTTFLILFLFAIIIHEVGHLIVAKVFNVKVSKFCVFYDPCFRLYDSGKMFSIRICLGWIPLGGYVRFASEDEVSSKDELIQNLHPFKRMAVYCAGVAVNFLVAYACLFAWVNNHSTKESRLSASEQVRYTNRMVSREMHCIVTSVAEYWGITSKEKNIIVNSQKTTKYVTHNKTTEVSRHWRILLLKFATMNLFLMMFNLLPLPPLDGAHVFHSLFELVFHKPVNQAYEIIAGCIGIILLIALNAIELVRFLCL